MSGDAFVVGDRLVVDQGAIREIRSSDYDSAGAFAVRGAGDVVGGSGGLEGGDGFDGDGRFGKEGEELWKLRLHLGDVVAIIFEDLIRGGWCVLGIGFE